MKCEASPQRFLNKFKQKNFFNINVHDKLHPGSATACVYGKFLVSYDVTSLFTNFPLQETIVIAINLSFNYNPNLNINKKTIKNISFLLHQRPIFFLIINFKIKLME